MLVMILVPLIAYLVSAAFTYRLVFRWRRSVHLPMVQYDVVNEHYSYNRIPKPSLAEAGRKWANGYRCRHYTLEMRTHARIWALLTALFWPVIVPAAFLGVGVAKSTSFVTSTVLHFLENDLLDTEEKKELEETACE